MIELKSITKVYRTKSGIDVNALNGISVAFRKSEFVSILGPSGCGKTTLLNVLGGLDSYTSGDLQVDGKSTSSFTDADWDAYRNNRIGFVFQSYNLIMHLSVLQNVELALTLSGVDSLTRKRKAMLALDRVGLANHLRKKPGELSGGEMQRVAIARAIVNDPDVILADEPTGALDSKNSVQVMDLLKDIAKDRLVIMVTHNDSLAASYSTRTIRLFDGKIVSDSNPYNHGQQEKSGYRSENAPKGSSSQNKNGHKSANANKKKSNKTSGENKTDNKKTSMKFGVALSLSFRNLLTKKARTLLTSVAASIGIVGLALVLALFNGLNVFLQKVQYDTLSSYPMTVTTSTTTDYEEYISVITDSSNYISDPNMKNKIFVSHLMTRLREATIRNKITKEYVDYVKNAPTEYLRDIGYYYGTGMNVYKKIVSFDLSGFNVDSAIVPKSINIENVKVSVASYFKQLVGDKDFVLSQYNLVAGKYPENKDELVLVLDKNNRISDAMLTTFLMDVNATRKDENGKYIVDSYEYEDFLGKYDEYGKWQESKYGVFTLALNDGLYGTSTKNLDTDYYKKLEESYEKQLKWLHPGQLEQFKKAISSLGVTVPKCYAGGTGSGKTLELKIVGILRLNENTTTGSMSAYPIGYTSALTEYINEQNANSAVVKAQLSEIEKVNVSAGVKGRRVTAAPDASNAYIDSEPAALNQLKALGYAELPTKIEFYATDFESKLKLKQYLAEYNNLNGVTAENRINVTDITSTIFSVLKTFIDTITGILLALTAISLLVAAIMIAVITYVSVIERTREIGVLRSIGARKFDVTLVFNAETIIIGLFSGLIGVFVAAVLQFPLNAILYSFTGISSLAVLSPLHALILVCVSILVTLIAGMIPAVMAARRDPVKALRSE